MKARRCCLLFVGLTLLILAGCRDGNGAPEPPARESGPEGPPTREESGPEGPPTEEISPGRVRGSVLAGTWYPGDGTALAALVDGLLDGASAPPEGHPIALIAPHAGLRYSGAIAGQAYGALRGRTYGRVFVIGPSHRVAFHGVSVPDFTHYETPLGRVPVDREAVALLRTHPLFVDHEDAHAEEHSVEIQLPFLQRALEGTRWTFVPLVAGRMSPEEAADAGAWLRSVMGPGDLLVASSDFTHWGQGFDYAGPPGAAFGPREAPARLPALMEDAWTAIRSGEPDRFWDHKRSTGDSICGFLPIVLLLQAVPSDAKYHRRATDTSGALTGDWSRSVSYLAAQVNGLWPYSGVGLGPELGVSDEEQGALLRLARGTVEAWVRERARPTPEELGVALTPRLRANSGVFVTLKKAGQLRGCVGTIPPARPLFQGVLDNAVNAATRDRRFPPVDPSELDEIEIEVSVLTPPVPVEGPWDVILGKHGVWIEKQGRSAVFLPQVAPEQGWTLPETLARLSLKANLAEDAWKEGMSFQVMEAIVFREDRP
ncbi:MAG: AmmeMemoRadiSam system protein B [Pseudomonadota bacterium]